jgi:hypothetical protein
MFTYRIGCRFNLTVHRIEIIVQLTEQGLNQKNSRKKQLCDITTTQNVHRIRL